MNVIDAESQWWFLLEEDGKIFLDASCNHSFFGYSFMIQLNEEELEAYAHGGHQFVSKIATEIQDSVPILAVSRSRFKGRDVTDLYAAKVASAVNAWHVVSKR
jgi:hypothetical protein